MKKYCIYFICFLFFYCSQQDCGSLTFDKKNKLTYLGNNLYSGNCNSFYFTGQLKSNESYLEGLDNGAWTYYFKNGNVQFSGTFKKGVRTGEWKYYHENGKLWKTANYSLNGERTGVWKEYSIEGILIDSTIIRDYN